MEEMLKKLKKICNDNKWSFNEKMKEIYNSEKLNYDELNEYLKEYIDQYEYNKKLERINLMNKVIQKYGYTKAKCITDEFPYTITKGKEYKVIYGDSLSNVSDVFLFDDNFELVPISNKWLEHENSDTVRIMIKHSGYKNKLNVLNCEYSVDEFKELIY